MTTIFIESAGADGNPILRVTGPKGAVEYTFMTNTLLADPTGFQRETLADLHADEMRLAVTTGAPGAAEQLLRAWYDDLDHIGSALDPAAKHRAGTRLRFGRIVVRRLPDGYDRLGPWYDDATGISYSHIAVDSLIADGGTVVRQ
jgi:hypothetical protein